MPDLRVDLGYKPKERDKLMGLPHEPMSEKEIKERETKTQFPRLNLSHHEGLDGLKVGDKVELKGVVVEVRSNSVEKKGKGTVKSGDADIEVMEVYRVKKAGRDESVQDDKTEISNGLSRAMKSASRKE